MSPETQNHQEEVADSSLTLTSFVDSIVSPKLRDDAREILEACHRYPEIPSKMPPSAKEMLRTAKEVLGRITLTPEAHNTLIEKEAQKRFETIMRVTENQDFLLVNTAAAITFFTLLKSCLSQKQTQIEIVQNSRISHFDLGRPDLPFFCLNMALNLLRQNFGHSSDSTKGTPFYLHASMII